MKGIKTLIRLHKLDLDEKRRLLAQFEAKQIELEEHIKHLAVVFEQEKKAAALSVMSAITFEVFTKAHKEKVANANKQLFAVKKQVDEMLDQVRDAFQTLKKYEIALDQSKRKKAEEAKLEEQKNNDEKAITGFRQKSGNP